MLNLAEAWRKKDFQAPGEGKNRLRQLVDETSRCIKCYTCIEICSAQDKNIRLYCRCPGKGPSFLCLPCAKLFPLLRIPVSTAGNAKNSVPWTSQMPFSYIPLRWSFRNYMVTRLGKISQSRISHQWKLSCGKKIGKISRAVRVGNFPCPPHQISCCKNETVSQKCQESRGLFSTCCQRRFRKQVRPGQGCCLS